MIQRLLICLALLGCGSSGSTGPAPSVGRLRVTITPDALTANVTVSGPNGYMQLLTGTATLSDLAPGAYTVTAGPVTGPHPVVGTTSYDPTVTGGAANVTAGSTADAAVSYAPQPGGTGALWVANLDASTVVAFHADRLGASTDAAPTISVGTGEVQYGAAFDADGDLWLAQTSADRVVEFKASQLASSGTPTPAVVLSTNAGSVTPPAPASLEGPIGLAFDAAGNLWVSNYYNNTVVAFAPAQLTTSGSPAPSVTLSAAGQSLNQPAGLAFDALGNLWVANTLQNTVVAFGSGQRGSSGAPDPVVTLSSTGTSLSFPFSLAFDAGGNLWVGNFNSNTVEQFPAFRLSANGAPSPAVTLSPVGLSLYPPVALAFDASGNLWVANQFANTVVRFAESQLRTGSPTPEVILSGVALMSPAALAFHPPTGTIRR
jgi:sugar lactone lactonase YvrE